MTSAKPSSERPGRLENGFVDWVGGDTGVRVR